MKRSSIEENEFLRNLVSVLIHNDTGNFWGYLSVSLNIGLQVACLGAGDHLLHDGI